MKPGHFLVFGAVMLGWSAGAKASEPVRYTIQEELPAHTFVGNIVRDTRLAQEYGFSVLTSFRYSFLESPTDDRRYFDLDESNGIIRTAQLIDRDILCPLERRCFLRLDIAVSPAQYFQVISVFVEIIDMNDNAPSFPAPAITRRIPESAPPLSSTLSLPIAEDPDGKNFSVQSYLLQGDSASLEKFHLRLAESLDGGQDLQLVLQEELDREVQGFYQLTVFAFDGGDPPKSGSVLVNITVEDTNDNEPRFELDTYNVDVPESLSIDSTIITVKAVDEDVGLNGRITYLFSARTLDRYGQVFAIEPSTGKVKLTQVLDYEDIKSYHLVVQARDGGADSRPALATVVVHVRDVNDSPPRATINTLTGPRALVPEDAPVGTFVAHVSVVDPDSGENGKVTCYLEDNNFELETFETSYKIITKDVLDRENQDSFLVTLICHDRGTPPLYSFDNVSIAVTDVNDNPPVFSQRQYTTRLTENNSREIPVIQVTATDRDIGDNGKIKYMFGEDAPKDILTINPMKGIIRASTALDYEKGSQIKFTVIAADLGEPSISATATVVINLLDVNDEAPYFNKTEYSMGIAENEPAGTMVGAVTAGDRDSAPFNVIEYAIRGDPKVHSAFSINPQTGVITTNRRLDREEKKSYYMTIVASNKGPMLSNQTTVIVHIGDINDNAPVFTFPVPHNNTVYRSNQVPLAYVITRVHAEDSDFGVNSRVSYLFEEPGAGAGLFELDERTGALTTTASLSAIGKQQFNLTIRAEDHGERSLHSTTDLYVVVTKGLKYSGGASYPDVPPNDDEARSNLNSTIVIAVGCASALVIMILVIAILCIHMKDRRGKAMHRYNCRMEAQKMLNATGGNSLQDDRMTASQSPSLSSPVPPPEGTEFTYRSYLQLHPQCSPMKSGDALGRCAVIDGPMAESSREGSPRSSPTGWEPVGSSQCWPSSFSHNLIEDPRGSSTRLCNGDDGDLIQPVTHTVGTQNPAAATRGILTTDGERQYPPPASHLVYPSALKQGDKRVGWSTLHDADAGSACSGEMSTTDSGRGGSEGSDGHPSSKLGTFHSPSDSGELERNNTSFDSSANNSFTVPRDKSSCCQGNSKPEASSGTLTSRTLGRVGSDYLPCPCQKSPQPSYDTYLPMHPMLSPNNTFSPARKNTHTLPSYPTVLETDLDNILEPKSPKRRSENSMHNGDASGQRGSGADHHRGRVAPANSSYGFTRAPVPAARHHVDRGGAYDGNATDAGDTTSVVSCTSGSYVIDNSEHPEYSLATLRESTA